MAKIEILESFENLFFQVNCEICGKEMGYSYLNEHKRIQHQGKVVPTRRCPICFSECQKIRNHFRYQHGLDAEQVEVMYKKSEAVK